MRESPRPVSRPVAPSGPKRAQFVCLLVRVSAFRSTLGWTISRAPNPTKGFVARATTCRCVRQVTDQNRQARTEVEANASAQPTADRARALASGQERVSAQRAYSLIDLRWLSSLSPLYCVSDAIKSTPTFAHLISEERERELWPTGQGKARNSLCNRLSASGQLRVCLCVRRVHCTQSSRKQR